MTGSAAHDSGVHGEHAIDRPQAPAPCINPTLELAPA